MLSKGTQHECFRNSGVKQSKGKRRKWTFREAHIWPPGFKNTYSDPRPGSVDRERVQEVGTEGKPKTCDFLVTGWLCKLSTSTHRWTGLQPQRIWHLSLPLHVAWWLMRQSMHQSSTSHAARVSSSSMPPVCPTVPLTDFLKVNLLEDRICALQTPHLFKHCHRWSHWGTQKT